MLITSTGGDNLVRTNVMSGNRGNGIEIGGNAWGVTVDPDIAGTNTDGNAALPNGGDGLRIDGTAHGNVVGGNLRSVIRQNTFSGNGGYGIVITGAAHGNRVFHSFVGTEILGTHGARERPRRHPDQRHRLPQRHRRRRPRLRNRNIISANHGIGVTLRAGTRHNAVIGNLIGINRTRQRTAELWPASAGPRSQEPDRRQPHLPVSQAARAIITRDPVS